MWTLTHLHIQHVHLIVQWTTTDDPVVFRDYQYTINNINPNFTTFQIKICLKSTQSTKVPRVKDFRVIALGT